MGLLIWTTGLRKGPQNGQRYGIRISLGTLPVPINGSPKKTMLLEEGFPPTNLLIMNEKYEVGKGFREENSEITGRETAVEFQKHLDLFGKSVSLVGPNPPLNVDGRLTMK